MRRYVSLIILILFGASAQADFAKRFMLCKLQKEVRTLRVDADEKTGKCHSSYTKFGKDQGIGDSSNIASCESFVNHVRTNLEGAGWKCHDVKEASVSQLADETL